MHSSNLLTAAFLLLSACSGSNSTPASAAAGGASGASGASQGGSAGHPQGGAGGAEVGGSAGTGGSSQAGPRFRRGANFGYVPGLNDAQMATLAFRAGANSARLSLPERHLDTWGWDIETADMASYATTGLADNVVFLSGPTAAHSSAPAGTADWERDYYIPKNLYEPIFLPDSTVNPNNYWAVYVQKTVQTYKTWIKLWSVWNEPDWVSDWQVTQTWDASAPTAAQLPRFHGSIFDYVRMLRITTEVAKKVDPDARIAVGGLGYPSFLSAVLRYTDNPSDGSITPDFPKKGADYFDVVDMHYYPVFTPGTSDVGAEGLLALKAEFEAKLDAAGASGRPFVVTETGAPHLAGSGPSGPEYARNYLLKAMTLAWAGGITGVDWFSLGDGENPSSDAFQAMGLYSNLYGLTDLNAASQTDSGIAYATLGKELEGAWYDAKETAALALGSQAAGAAFRYSNDPMGVRGWVLWARTSGTSESATATLQLKTYMNILQVEWNHSQDSNATQWIGSSGGAATLELIGTPRIFVEVGDPK